MVDGEAAVLRHRVAAASSLVRVRAEEAVTRARRAPAATGPDPTTPSNLLDIQVIGWRSVAARPRRSGLPAAFPTSTTGRSSAGSTGGSDAAWLACGPTTWPAPVMT
jgi:hypothetical protein